MGESGRHEGAVGAARTTLLVASAGGHLSQLVSLAAKLDPPPDKIVWATYPTGLNQLDAADDPILPVFHPTTRHARNAVRNYGLAKLLLDTYDVSEVISTGAGVAVPFLYVAARRGIPAFYIESATRSVSPSLSGQLLERNRKIRLFTQNDSPGFSRRWTRLPTPFCDFEGSEDPDAPAKVRKVLVSLGLHESYPFDRVVRRLVEILPSDVDVVWQLGSTKGASLPGQVLGAVPASEFQRRLREADVVVAHAGTGVALSAMREGKAPVLVPRRKATGEHVDDHQLLTAQIVESLGIGISVDASELTLSDLERAAAIRVRPAPGPPRRLSLEGRSVATGSVA